MEKKEEYIRKLDMQLREWSAKIDELKAKADKMKDEAKIKYSGLFETWDKEKEQVQNKIKELKEASAPAWEELKLGIENSWQEMKTGLDNARAKLMTTKAIPEDYHSVTPILVFKDARKAIEFYKRAFGAQERYAMPGPDGKGVMHAALRIGNSIIMMGEENPQQPCKSAETIGGSPVSFYLYIENVDEAFRIALDAGAEAGCLSRTCSGGTASIR